MFNPLIYINTDKNFSIYKILIILIKYIKKTIIVKILIAYLS